MFRIKCITFTFGYLPKLQQKLGGQLEIRNSVHFKHISFVLRNTCIYGYMCVFDKWAI